jgi:hypothetical protein
MFQILVTTAYSRRSGDNYKDEKITIGAVIVSNNNKEMLRGSDDNTCNSYCDNYYYLFLHSS